jgi:hypothetical protein
VRLCCTGLVAATALQRIRLPVGGIPLALIVCSTLVVGAASNRVVRVRRRVRGAFLLALLLASCASLTLLLSGKSWSLGSLLLFVVLYAPLTTSVPHASRQAFDRVCRFFVGMMGVFAVIGLLQIGSQLAGANYVDLVGMLPRSVVIQGFNTSYPIIYGSNIFRSNGVVFLEASFYSQFLALAILLHLRRRGGTFTLLLLLGAMASSLSGTGIMLLIVGLVTFVTRDRLRLFARAGRLVLLPAAAALFLLTPLGGLFVQRLTETGPDSSSNLRFADPFVRLIFRPIGDLDVSGVLLGHGAGNADQGLEAGRGLQAPALIKAYFEYGLVAGAAMVGFLVSLFRWRRPATGLAIVFVVLFTALSGALLLPVVVYTAFFLHMVWPPASQARPQEVLCGY